MSLSAVKWNATQKNQPEDTDQKSTQEKPLI